MPRSNCRPSRSARRRPNHTIPMEGSRPVGSIFSKVVDLSTRARPRTSRTISRLIIDINMQCSARPFKANAAATTARTAMSAIYRQLSRALGRLFQFARRLLPSSGFATCAILKDGVVGKGLSPVLPEERLSTAASRSRVRAAARTAEGRLSRPAHAPPGYQGVAALQSC